MPASSWTSRTAAAAQGILPLALVAVNGSAGKHPGPAHEPGLGIALDQQQLQRVGAASEQDHRRGEAGSGLLAGVQFLSGCGAVDVHPPTLQPATPLGLQQVTKWMCESCGFIYDPDEGDPDGGIPPGTRFEDIPETWFCPVCGARKRDFTPYED